MLVSQDLAEMMKVSVPHWSVMEAIDAEAAIEALSRSPSVPTIAIVHLDGTDGHAKPLLSRLISDGTAIVLIDGESLAQEARLPRGRFRTLSQPYSSEAVDAAIGDALALYGDGSGPHRCPAQSNHAPR